MRNSYSQYFRRPYQYKKNKMQIFPTKLNLREQEVVRDLINKNRLFWLFFGLLLGFLGGYAMAMLSRLQPF